MGKEHHHHDHSHSHHHHGEMAGKKLYLAVFINVLLTVAQIIGGILSGSLSLIADALHNFSDAGALLIAAIAAKIANIPANDKMTYGYKRAEILGALINSTTLVIVGVYLIYEAINRYFEQTPIDGMIVVWVAGVALVIDILTAFLTYHGAKESMNIRAAFIHNVSDAAASVVVIISGLLIMYYQVYVVDLIATLLISAYILYHAFYLIKDSILILMQSTPGHLKVEDIKKSIEENQDIKEAHHIHVWQLDDKKIFLEAHIVVSEQSLARIEAIKSDIRVKLKNLYAIHHTTFEFETTVNCQNC